MRTYTRRAALGLGVAALAAAGGDPACAEDVAARIAAFTRGAEPDDRRRITLTLPEVAEIGVSVPASFNAPGAEAVLLLAPANPDPQASMFRFGPLAGSRAVETRIRLAESQTVHAIARFPGGRYAQAQAAISVVIGGCPS